MTNAGARSLAAAAEPPKIGRVSVWMTRGLALTLAVYALFSCWALLYNVTPVATATAGVFGSAAVGLWRLRPWSRWIVYAISAVVCVWFVWYVSKLVQGGWPNEDGTRSVTAVLPALLLVLCAIAAAVHVRRVFKPR
jgi:ABC-type glucose/galactose transport system permease subunit